MKPSRGSLVWRYVVLSLLAVAFLVPFYIIVRNAFSTTPWIVSPEWHWLPNAVNLDNLRSVLDNSSVPVLQSMGVSAIVAVTQTVATVLISMMAGYGLARFDHRAAKVLLGLTVFTLMVPATVTFVPTFVMVSTLGWISTLRGLIIPLLFSAFATYLFRQFYLGFPRELEESAYVDGASPWGLFWRIVVPNSWGMIAAVGTITFIGAWNNFLWPLLIGQSDDTRTIQVTLSRFMTSQGIQYPQIFTGALIAILPVLVVFLFLQRHLVLGVERSGID